MTLAANMPRQPGGMKARAGVSRGQALCGLRGFGGVRHAAAECGPIIESCSHSGRGDEIWTPFLNIPYNNCVDKRRQLPSAGMSWHLDNWL